MADLGRVDRLDRVLITGLAARRIVRLVQSDAIFEGLRSKVQRWMLNEGEFPECEPCSGTGRVESRWVSGATSECATCAGDGVLLEPVLPRRELEGRAGALGEKALEKGEYVLFGCHHCLGIWVALCLAVLARWALLGGGLRRVVGRALWWLCGSVLAPAELVSLKKPV